MCRCKNGYGDCKKVLVTIPKELSHTGKERKAYKPIDSCIADIVKALNKGGIKTEFSCCGHKKGKRSIIMLSDGRDIIIEERRTPKNNSKNNKIIADFLRKEKTVSKNKDIF